MTTSIVELTGIGDRQNKCFKDVPEHILRESGMNSVSWEMATWASWNVANAKKLGMINSERGSGGETLWKVALATERGDTTLILSMKGGHTYNTWGTTAIVSYDYKEQDNDLFLFYLSSCSSRSPAAWLPVPRGNKNAIIAPLVSIPFS